MESKAENLGCSHSTARVSNTAIRKKVRAMNAIFSCAESIWAGRDRTVNIGKDGFQFAVVSQIARLMDVFDKEFLTKYTPCVGMFDEQLIEAIAMVHIELILIHPFREGNGRIARLLANVMAMQTGKPELDFSMRDKNKIAYFAAIQSGMSDYGQMKALVRQVLHDSESAEDD